MEEILQTIYQGVLEGDRDIVKQKVQESIDSGLKPGDILQKGLIPAMAEVGQLFEKGEFFVPEMLIAARAMQEGLGILKPLLVEAKVQSAGKVIIGTVKGDLHDIGKNLVSMMLEGAGFEVTDLGVDISPEEFVRAVEDNPIDIIALSALLTSTMPNMEATIKALRESKSNNQVKIMIGGAPVTQDYANKIGSDGYAPDASLAVSLAKLMISS